MSSSPPSRTKADLWSTMGPKRCNAPSTQPVESSIAFLATLDPCRNNLKITHRFSERTDRLYRSLSGACRRSRNAARRNLARTRRSVAPRQGARDRRGGGFRPCTGGFLSPQLRFQWVSKEVCFVRTRAFQDPWVGAPSRTYGVYP